VKRIHIVGSGPRTGTTLIAEMIIACFEIDLHTEHEDSIYTWPPCRGNIFLTKKPRDILVIEPILRIMRNLCVIYMVRDPRDMIVSKHKRDPERYWANLQFWKTYTAYGRRLQSHPRFISVRYEDLLTQPGQIQDYLMKRMPFLIKKASFNSYHKIAQPSKDSMVAGQLQLHGSISEDLIAYGYEQDAAWEKELEGIGPDLSAGHFPDNFTVKRVKHWDRGKYVKAIGVVVGQYRLAQLVRNVLKTVYRKLGSLLGHS
jgi:hypothetical protein